jgi:hypothetical protein
VGALLYLQGWVDGHPNDSQASGLLQEERAMLGIRSPAPPPSGVLNP